MKKNTLTIKIDKKSLILIVVAILSIALLYQQSYAKYIKRVQSGMDINMASWNILVNDESILGKDTLTNQITPVFLGDQYVKDGVIAPGATGYFDIEIDPSAVDVAFSYQISATIDNEDIEDIVIYQYQVLPDGSLTSYTGSITGNLQLNSDAITYRIYVKWLDGLGETMDNASDTALAINNQNITFTVSITLQQITN